MSVSKKIPLFICMFVFSIAALFFSSRAYAAQNYNVNDMSGLYTGTWIHTVYGFTYYEPTTGFADMRGSADAIRSDAVYYRYNKDMDLFVLIYRGFQDYEPSLNGIRGYVAGLGCTDIIDVNCNGLNAVQFLHTRDNTKELSIAFPDQEGAIMQITVQCPDDAVRNQFGNEVFRSVMPDEASASYLSSTGQEAYSYAYHLDDFGSVYGSEWRSLLNFFRFYAPTDQGWTDLTGTQDALSCDAIAMFQNKTLGIIIIVYYGYQDYDTTPGIYEALVTNPSYQNVRYVSCNGLKSVEFDNGGNDKMIAFADSTGGIVQVTVQCADSAIRQLYANQLFSSVSPLDMDSGSDISATYTDNGNDIPAAYKSLLSQYEFTADDEVISLENSEYAIIDINQDGTPELLIYTLYPVLPRMNVFTIYNGSVQYSGSLEIGNSHTNVGYTESGYYYWCEYGYDYDYLLFNIYRLDGSLLNKEKYISFVLDNGLKATIDDQDVSFEEANNLIQTYFGSEVSLENNELHLHCVLHPNYTDNIYYGLELDSSTPTESASDGMELSGLIGQDIETVATQLGFTNTISSGTYSISYYNETLFLGSLYSGVLSTISIYSTSPYTLYGMHTSINQDEFQQIAVSKGLQPTKVPNIYTNGSNLFLYYDEYDGDVRLSLRQYNFPDSTGRIEVSNYLGATISDVKSAFPDLSYEETTDYVRWYDDGVSFQGVNTGNGQNTVIQYIDITSDRYCTYGYSRDIFLGDMGFSNAATGEYVDPYGDVIVLRENDYYLKTLDSDYLRW